LNRNENQTKNEFYRKIFPQEKVMSKINVIKIIQGFEDLLDLYFPPYENEDFFQAVFDSQ
jgi:hypothetical protein